MNPSVPPNPSSVQPEMGPQSPSAQPEPAAESAPWYHAGLSFRCTGCGDCCTGDPGAVWVTDEEIDGIAAHLGVPVGEVRLLQTHRVGNRISLREYPNGDCIFFDGRSRRCQIYPARPSQCRTWPFWNAHLSSPEAWKNVCEICPGAGTGDLVPLTEIEHRRQQNDI